MGNLGYVISKEEMKSILSTPPPSTSGVVPEIIGLLFRFRDSSKNLLPQIKISPIYSNFTPHTPPISDENYNKELLFTYDDGSTNAFIFDGSNKEDYYGKLQFKT